MNRFQSTLIALGTACALAITVEAVVAADADMDIVDTAVSAGNFQTLAAALTAAATVNGQSVDISMHGSNVMVDGAKVVMTDIMANNGVIHVIDSVILPE